MANGDLITYESGNSPRNISRLWNPSEGELEELIKIGRQQEREGGSIRRTLNKEGYPVFELVKEDTYSKD